MHDGKGEVVESFVGRCFAVGLCALALGCSPSGSSGDSRRCLGVCGVTPGATCASQYPSNDCLQHVCCVLAADSGPPFYDDAGSCPGSLCASPDDVGCGTVPGSPISASWYRSKICDVGDLCCVVTERDAAVDAGDASRD
jgi:hypothetical protein